MRRFVNGLVALQCVVALASAEQSQHRGLQAWKDTRYPSAEIPSCQKCIGYPQSFIYETSKSYTCLDYWGATYGTCCQNGKASGGGGYSPCDDSARNKKTLCSNRAPKEKNINYAFCPFQPAKCYQKPVFAVQGTQSHLVATTLEFKENDYCAWKIVPTDTDLYFSRYLNLTVLEVLDVVCAIYHGDTIDSMLQSEPIDCSKKNATSFAKQYIPASHHVTIVVTGTSNQAYASIEYELADYLDTLSLQIGLGLAACIIICTVNFFILFVLQKTTRVQFSKVENTYKEHGVYMSVEMTKSEWAYEEFQKLPKEITDPIPSEGSTAVKSNKKNQIRNAPAPMDQTMEDSRISNNNSQISLVDRKAQAEMNALNQQQQMQMMNQMNNMMMTRMMVNMMKEMQDLKQPNNPQNRGGGDNQQQPEIPTKPERNAPMSQKSRRAVAPSDAPRPSNNDRGKSRESKART